MSALGARPPSCLWAGDPLFTGPQQLRDGSPESAAWRDAHDVRAAAAGHELLLRPKRGTLRFEHAGFQANDDPSLGLVIYTRL